MSYVFISYSHQDTEYAHKVADELQKEQIAAWIDDRIDYGSRWPHVIQEQLDNCTAFIVIMSPRAYGSDWVQNELSRAQRKGKPIFPMLLEGDIWLSVEARQCVDVTNSQLPSKGFYDNIALYTPRKTILDLLNEYIEKVQYYQERIDDGYTKLELDKLGDSMDDHRNTSNYLRTKLYKGMPSNEVNRIIKMSAAANAKLGRALLQFAESVSKLIPDLRLNWRNYRNSLIAMLSTGETHELIPKESLIAFRSTLLTGIEDTRRLVDKITTSEFSTIADHAHVDEVQFKKSAVAAENAVKAYSEELVIGIGYLESVVKLIDERLLMYHDNT